MPIEVHCSGCQSTIRVRDELAGRSGSCKHCGSSITIPRPEDTGAGRLLADASPVEMVKELRRRQHRALLLLVDGEQSNPISGDQLNRDTLSLKSIGDDLFDQGQLAAIYQQLAEASAQRANTQRAEQDDDEDDVFSLKGDPLGMSLADFKKKHLRRAAGSDRVAPLCSDEYPGRKIPDLLTEAWHGAAGIVHARLDLPEERSPPTVAGAQSELLIYQFVDGRLFQITGIFSPEAFHAVNSALSSKYGKPMSEGHSPRRAEWWTMSSKIYLTQGSLRPPQPTILSYQHDELMAEASTRKPDNTADL